MSQPCPSDVIRSGSMLELRMASSFREKEAHVQY